MAILSNKKLKNALACLLMYVSILPAHAQEQKSIYQLLYVYEGTIQNNKNTVLQVGKYYTEDTKITLNAKKAIFYDTTRQELATVVYQKKEALPLKNTALPVRIEGFRCCVTGFTSFVTHHLKPYPILYEDVILPLSGTDEQKYTPQKIAYKFWNIHENKFQMKLAPMIYSSGAYAVELYKIVESIQKIQPQNTIEPFFFYQYDKSNPEPSTLIKERALVIIYAPTLKAQMAEFVKVLQKKYPKPEKPDKEIMLLLLSDFVHELYGYPDELYFKKWLKEHFSLDLFWE
jgi:hypothetical protein